MYFWVEVYMFFVLHNYYDINIIFFVFVALKKGVYHSQTFLYLDVFSLDFDH